MGEASAAESNLGVFCASGWHTGSLTMRLITSDTEKGGGMGAGTGDRCRSGRHGDALRPIEVMEALRVEITGRTRAW